MSRVGAVHRFHEAKVVRDGRDIRKKVANRCAALAVLLTRPGRFQEKVLGFVGSDAGGLEREGLSRVARQERFGIKQIHGRWAAVHEEKDDPLGSAWKRGGFGFSRGFTGKHRLQSKSTKSGSGSLKHFPTGKRKSRSIIT